MPAIANRIDKIIQWLIVITLPLIPFFFLPFTQDYYDTNKWLLLFVVALVIVVLWSIRTVMSHTIAVNAGWPVWGFGALLLASVISLALASPNKYEALIAPYSLTLFASFGIFFFLGHMTMSAKGKRALRFLWYATSALLSLVAIYQFFGVGASMFPAIAFLANGLWTPVGSTLSLIALLAVTVPLIVQDLAYAIKNKEDAGMAILFSLVLVVMAGLTVTIAKLLPQANQITLSVKDGWAITLEVLKDPKRALFGVGVENFLYAFTTGRPVTLNTTPLWNLRFTTNASLFLHLTATMGALGVIATIILARSYLVNSVVTGASVARIFAIISMLFVPPTITIFALYAVVLFLTEPEHGKPVAFVLPANARFVYGGLAIILVSLVILSGYIFGRAYAAETVFFRSLQALQKNDGTATYNTQIQAATMGSQVSRFHLAYSQTNLAIANAMATQSQSANPSQPTTLSDQDRQTISSLIQQAIREAKIAVNLAPENVVAWENLAALYQSLINVVADVDQWAIASYQRAIQLDPTNPALRLGLGSVFLLRNDPGSAIQQFTIAINLKPDWANAHYNLAYAYKLQKDNLRTAVELQQTLSTLPGDSTDRARVEKELQDTVSLLSPAEKAVLEGRQPTQEELQAGSVLTRPDQQPLPVITPKLELPPDASPPAQAQQTQEVAGEGATQGLTTEFGPEEVNPTVQPQQP